MSWWQQLPSHISPVLFNLGTFELRWYGICYFTAILVSFLLSSYRVRHAEYPVKQAQVEDYYFWVILGVVIGARLGYVLFYQPEYYSSNPLEIILPFRFERGFHFTGISGLSFHGGWIGSILATVFFCRKNKLKALEFLDFIVPSVPAGYMFGRIGNFLNGELWGRATTSGVGMLFPNDPTQLPRHPSQLYEMLGEGFLLFLILWPLRNKKFFPGWIFCAYAFGYGLVRFFLEYFREPDAQLGLLKLGFSMGQWLCVGMMIVASILGVTFFFLKKTDEPRATSHGLRKL